jgi:hypothetical protein
MRGRGTVALREDLERIAPEFNTSAAGVISSDHGIVAEPTGASTGRRRMRLMRDLA